MLESTTILTSLVEGVQKAAECTASGSERDVVTLISRKMWQLFLMTLGECPDLEPAEQWGEGPLVFGSRTIIVPGDGAFAVSFPA